MQLETTSICLRQLRELQVDPSGASLATSGIGANRELRDGSSTGGGAISLQTVASNGCVGLGRGMGGREGARLRHGAFSFSDENLHGCESNNFVLNNAIYYYLVVLCAVK